MTKYVHRRAGLRALCLGLEGVVELVLGPLLAGATLALLVPIAIVIILVSLRHIPESSDPEATGRMDWTGVAPGGDPRVYVAAHAKNLATEPSLYAADFANLGAQISTEGNTAFIKGVERLVGARVGA